MSGQLSRLRLPLIFFILLALLAGCSVNSSSDSIYINSQRGNDDGPGTFRRPVKTIDEVNRRLDGSQRNIYFAGGLVYRGTLKIDNINATKGNPVRISSTGRKRAIINGGNNEAVIVRNCSHIVISSLILKGNGRMDGNTANGITLINTHHGIISNLRSEGFQKSGVELKNSHHIDVRRVKAFSNGFAGINITGTTRDSSRVITVTDCVAENNPGDPTKLDNHSGNGILAGVSDSVIIERCIATNNGWDMPRKGNGPVGIWAWECSHVHIKYCISYSNKTPEGAKDGGGFDLDGGVTDSEIRYCISFNNHGAGYGLFQYAGASTWHGNKIQWCISLRDAVRTEGAGSIFVWNGTNDTEQMKDCHIKNNLVINSRKPLVSYESSSSHRDFFFSDNLFIGPERISGSDSGSIFIKNRWIGGKK